MPSCAESSCTLMVVFSILHTSVSVDFGHKSATFVSEGGICEGLLQSDLGFSVCFHLEDCIVWRQILVAGAAALIQSFLVMLQFAVLPLPFPILHNRCLQSFLHLDRLFPPVAGNSLSGDIRRYKRFCNLLLYLSSL
nr:MAG TPA: hypothetical protein [Caudoviricetes sp.]